MNYLFSITMLFMFSVTLHAQRDVTQFLGIPVDGTKTEMMKRLEEKGFTQTKRLDADFLEGEFNGCDVNIYIDTNNNKVYRIIVADANVRDEVNIKIRFNKLVNQFENNKKYCCTEDQRIPESEDISYEMSVHNKVYEANFFQVLDKEKIDSVALQQQVRKEFLKKYTIEQLQNPGEEVRNALIEAATNECINLMMNKFVWFRIQEFYGQYYIAMYY